MTNVKQSKKPVPLMQVLGVLAVFCLLCIALIPTVAAGDAGAADVATASNPWSGTWDTHGSTTVASQTIGILTLTQSGSKVTGTFSNNDNGKGTISGIVSGSKLVGTWSVDYGTESDSGSLVFVLSDNKKSFDGKWISASDKIQTMSTSSEFWNGARM